MGYTPDEIIKLFNYFAKSVLLPSPKYAIDEIKEKRGFKLGGIMSSYAIESIMDETAKLKEIESIKDIKMPIAIPAVDLITSKEIIFTNMEKMRKKKTKIQRKIQKI